ncbi:hypothetical protein [Erwinia sp. QL-Z3]|uniref:hypothetical protein n=1 Tax=Erwinia sp. QL-Z3 TaxID=2547962 RepID=UPI001070A21F|nr:hypothetical protein [Erwinia sp. QL-Z3]QBR50355.1 hypothetical protein E2F51_10390 [Erwinia sp. QL-Z3]
MVTKEKDFIFEPILFLQSGRIFLVRGSFEINFPFELITDIELEKELSLDQKLPKGYLVWQDAIDNSVSKFRLSDKYSEAENFIAESEGIFSVYQKKKSLEYRKSKIKNNNNKYDDFFMSVIGESYYHMKMLSIRRFIIGYDESDLLEKMYIIYTSGLYPCGLKKDGEIVAFNPESLKL